MTWLSRICSSVVAAAVLASGATVTGRVVLEGSKEKRVRKQRDYSSVIVWLEPVREVEVRPRSARILQKDKTFTPHVLAVTVGSVVDFPNLDPIFHNAFSNYSGQIFDVGLYPPGATRMVRFRRDGIVRVFCNIHPTMSAVIAVLKTPWFDVTEREGRFQLADVPPGEYTLKLFHERATEAALSGLQRKVTVSRDAALAPIAISEAGYLPVPHKNKYGKEYPATINDSLVPYSGAQK